MNSLKGQLLIATPQLLAPIFTRSVILMLEHNEDGAMGVILNQPINTTITDLAGKIFEEGFEWDKPLSLGGPVPGPLMVLHTVEELSDQEVLPGIFHTLEASRVQEVIRRRPEPSLVIANYSGWGPGQLEGEFGWDSWLTLPARDDYVFWVGEKDLWKVVVNQVNAGSSPSSSSSATCRPIELQLGRLSMKRNLVLTLTGPDRIGIVEKVTGLLLERGGNVETSRMARLGGEFAVLMLVSLPPSAAPTSTRPSTAWLPRASRSRRHRPRRPTPRPSSLASLSDRCPGGRSRGNHSRGAHYCQNAESTSNP